MFEYNYLNCFNEDPYVMIVILMFGVIGLFLHKWWLMWTAIGGAALLIWFFRAPLKQIPVYKLQSDELYSPAYGIIESIQHIGNQYKVMIFLSIFDVHIQYFPTSGNVIRQVYSPYEVKTIMNNLVGSGESREIMIVQRIGYVARRIYTPKHSGAVLAGSRLGIIKLGSHVDIYFSDKYELKIKVGEYAAGSNTLIAKWTG